MKYTTEQIAARFGVSTDRIKEAHRLNAIEAERMAARARKSGRKVNGYTAEEWDATAAASKAKSL